MLWDIPYCKNSKVISLQDLKHPNVSKKVKLQKKIVRLTRVETLKDMK
jgi:hypothetical protein